ncbi:MarR family winged helix-turn-helix transcriptional regulator [Kordia jejudonensis]|uniref:MarR family winged helix-turn-helix transcriptional regulator n=1 Tax=Kordia jejudonensis TaxID=1348245 RepID=UPI000629C3DB|nr:MarR family transcriptional regulator [Kordia jejudonensis]
MGDISKDIQSSFPSDRVKAFINIKFTANWINSKENEFFKPFGISPQQFNILRILRGAGKAIKVQEIKDRMIERAPNATRLMDKLCAKDLIERIPCPDDRRVVHIAIKDNGLKLLKQIGDSMPKNDWLGNLTDEEATQLSNLLDKVR